MAALIPDSADWIGRSGRYLHFRRTTRSWIVVAWSSAIMISAPAVAPAAPEIPHQPGISMPSGPVTTAAGELASLIGDLNMGGKYAGSVTTMRVAESIGRVIVYAFDTRQAADAAAAASDRLDHKKRARVTVEVRASMYSRQELKAAIALLWEEAKDWRRSGIELFVIALNSDGSGLTAEVNDPDNAALVATRAGAESIGAVSRTDVSFKRGGPPMDATRFFDTPPYNAGIFVQGRGNRCTTAFRSSRVLRNFSSPQNTVSR